MKYVLAIIVAILVVAAGFFVGRSQQEVSLIQKQEQVSIYFLKPDGLYRILSDKEGEEKLLEGQFNNLELASDKLILASESALMTYDLASGQAATVQPEVGTVHFSAAVSPAGSHLAYTKSIEVPSDGYGGFKNELWLMDLVSGEKQKLLEEEAYYLLRLNRWLSDQQLLVGRAYESVSYCPFTVGVDTSLPEQCLGYGSEAVGILDRIFAADNGVFYGVKRISPEFGSLTDQTGLYSQMGTNRQFLRDALATSLVKSGDVLYLTKLLDDKSGYGSVEADIYSFNLSDESLKRLTHDATSVDTKENLKISNKGRFLTYDSNQISTNTTKAWLYDLKLNQYYSIGDNTFSAVVIER